MTTATLEATAVKERPILFSGEMVKAILEGRKTQTRRVIKPQPLPTAQEFVRWTVQEERQYRGKTPLWIACLKSGLGQEYGCPYGEVGDRLWVRETWRPALSDTHECFAYRADRRYRCGKPMPSPAGSTAGWKPSIHMPRAASRLLLEVTDVRVQRLKDTSEEDAIAEGVERDGDGWRCYGNCAVHVTGHDKRTSATASFMSLWDSINAAKYPWDSNCWIWAISFKRVEVASATA